MCTLPAWATTGVRLVAHAGSAFRSWLLWKNDGQIDGKDRCKVRSDAQQEWATVELVAPTCHTISKENWPVCWFGVIFRANGLQNPIQRTEFSLEPTHSPEAEGVQPVLQC